METAVLGILAFVAVTLVGVGLFGRPDQSKPQCSKCRRDAREFAWDDEPTCACGARLDKPGAVRTLGRIRRPRVLIIGIVMFVLVLVGAWWTKSLLQRGLDWRDRAPSAVLTEGLKRNWEWCLASLDRRVQANDLDPDVCADLLVEEMQRRAAANPMKLPFSRAHDFLTYAWQQNPRRLAELAPHVSGFSMTLDTAPNEKGELGFQITVGGSDQRWFARVDRISVNGLEVPFTMMCDDMLVTRVAQRWASGTLQLPADSGATIAAEITFDVILAHSEARPGAIGDPIIDSTEPPERWGITAITVPIRHTEKRTFGGGS